MLDDAQLVGDDPAHRLHQDRGSRHVLGLDDDLDYLVTTRSNRGQWGQGQTEQHQSREQTDVQGVIREGNCFHNTSPLQV